MNTINSDLSYSICQFNEIIDIFHYACSNREKMKSVQSYLKRQIKAPIVPIMPLRYKLLESRGLANPKTKKWE